MKSWKKRSRKRRLTGHGAFREPMSFKEHTKRMERNLRRNRAQRIFAKSKVIPGAKQPN